MRFLDHDAVNAKTGKRSKTQRWRDIKADLFPQPAKEGQRLRWFENEIDSYLRWRLALRDGTTKIERWSEGRKHDAAQADDLQAA